VRRHESEGRVAQAGRLDVFVGGDRPETGVGRGFARWIAVDGSENVSRAAGDFLHWRNWRDFWALDIRWCARGGAIAYFQQGVDYAKGEFIQVHPTGSREDKLRLMSESAREKAGHLGPAKIRRRSGGQGIPKQSDFIFWKSVSEVRNLVPRDIATPRFTALCIRRNWDRRTSSGVFGRDAHPRRRGPQLEDLEIYEKFSESIHAKSDESLSAMHYTMGGYVVNGEDQATECAGNFTRRAECEYQYHGANRLGANSLVSAFLAGQSPGPRR